jgi:Kef-type K+ transport system membrane component KefB
VVSNVGRGRLYGFDIALTSILAVGFTVIVATWGTRSAGRLVSRIQLRVAKGPYAFSVTALLALSLLAVYAGIAAIVGAFLTGMTVGHSIGHRVGDVTRGVAGRWYRSSRWASACAWANAS